MPFMRQSAGVNCRDRYRLVNGEDCGEDCFLGSSSSFAALGGGKLLEAFVAWRAIYPGVNLGTIPKATATFANFQMYAQFHDCLSRNV